MIEMLIGAVMLLTAAGVGLIIILVAVNVALFLRLRSRIPQQLPSDPADALDIYERG